MALFNKIQELVESHGISVYRFRQDTGIGLRTAYDLYNDPTMVPGGKVLDKICSAYGIQPGEILHWEGK